MRNNKLLGRGLAVVGLLLSMLLAGCGGAAATGDVSGKVLFQGKPLPSGRIAFLCEGGDKPVVTGMIKDGAYTVEKAAVGPAKVTVETFQSRSDVKPPPGMNPLPGGDSPAGPYVPIPQKYRAADTSGLAYTVVKGKQTKDFELTP